ncbi:MAG: GNAT family N-acetyltransferase [Oscillospiraceae bacterium]|nr:GNAT family N-acetyltransferase [Oscillospiraceae bacterium]
MRLYELDYSSYVQQDITTQIQRKKLRLFDLRLPGEENSLKTRLGRLYFCLISKGRFTVYYATDPETGNVLHTSYVTGPGYKFPFMHKGDIHIGPCYTAPQARGKGLYKQALRTIHRDHSAGKGRAYMLVAEDNTPSIRGIEACGFLHTGRAEKHSLLKIYRRLPK